VEPLLFTPLPSPQSRWASFLTAWGVQTLSLASLLFLGARFHQALIPQTDYRITNLVAYEHLVLPEPERVAPPVSTRSTPPPKKKPVVKREPVLESKPFVPKLVVTPQLRAEHKPTEPDLAPPALKLESRTPVVPTAPPPKIVAVGTFSPSNPAPTIANATAVVHAAGFGDPNGISASDRHGPPNIAAKGFDFPSASHVNGAGAGSPNVLANAGFSNLADGAIKAGARKMPSLQPSNAANTPVEITFKPKPDYTDEGRKQKINGEVRLEVLFTSDGRAHVLRVLRGLGYGLDEEAVKAAEQIKFKPALREGQPIDSTALVHIIFELIS